MMKCRMVHISAAIVGTLVGAAYYYWFWERRPKDSIIAESNPSSSTTDTKEPRPKAGMDVNTDQLENEDFSSSPMDLFRIGDERVRDVFERLFQEQISLGEELMNDDETLERGAIHLSNAIALTGEADKLLNILRQTFPIAKYSRVLKYMPTADLRVNQMLQDELEDETIAAIFG